jgi:hypothetical protein
MVEEYTVSQNTGTEDVESIENDIPTLAQKYIVPIDRVRSISSKDPSGRYSESRCHAFYRYIGFPTACSDNSFYSPGYSPASSSIQNPKNTVIFRKNVDSKFNTNDALKNLIGERESDFKTLRDIFARQDLSAALYAYVLRKIRPFGGIMDEVNIEDPFNADEQTFKLDDRAQIIDNFSQNNTNLSSDITSVLTKISTFTRLGKLDEGRHILKPFIVDPDIAKNIQPPENIICAPFLKSATDTKLNKNTMLQRPVLEAILRARLENAQSSDSFLATMVEILNSSKEPLQNVEALDSNTLKFTIAAISEDNEFSIDTFSNDFKSGISSIQLINISKLIKQLKVIIRELQRSFAAIDLAIKEINWFPVPGVEGPEIIRGASLYKFGTSYTELDKQMVDLKAQIFAANSSKTDWTNLGNFAGPFVAYNTENVEAYNSQIDDLQQQKNKYSNDAFQALSNIELISGEVSGLGLIDIISIYAALWSMKETHLVAMLDDDSFNRLINNNPNLITSSVSDRDSGISSVTITDALIEFQKKLVNILSFVDKEFARQSINPTDEDGGMLDA